MDEFADGRRGEGSEPQTAQLLRLNRTLWIAIAIALAVIVLARAGSTLIVIFAGVLLGTVLHGVSEQMSRRLPLGYAASLAVVCIAVIVALGLTAWWLGPHIADQISQLSEELRSSWERLLERLRNSSMLHGFVENLSWQELASRMGSVAGGLMSVANAIFAALGGMIVILFIGIYAAAEPRAYTAGAIWLMPSGRREQTRRVLTAIASTLQWWFIARLMSMAVVGLLTGLGLWLIGMPLFVALGLLSALLCFVPYLGPILSSIPAILIGLAQSPTMGVWVVALYLGVQTVESYLITPQFVQRAISVPAAAILVVQLLFGVFFGILGVAFASPISATILTIVKMTVSRPALEGSARET